MNLICKKFQKLNLICLRLNLECKICIIGLSLFRPSISTISVNTCKTKQNRIHFKILVQTSKSCKFMHTQTPLTKKKTTSQNTENLPTNEPVSKHDKTARNSERIWRIDPLSSGTYSRRFSKIKRIDRAGD